MDTAEASRTVAYTIRLDCNLDPSWLDWFEGFSIILQMNGTALVGILTDQPGLHDLLSKINNENLSLVSVSRLTQARVPASILFRGITFDNPS